MKRRALSILCLLALLTLVLAVVPGTAALRLDAVQDTQLPPPKAEPSIQAIRTPADAPGTPSASEDAHAEKARLSPQSILLDEGFEGGAVPPSGWTLVQTNLRETWGLYTSPPYANPPPEGDYAATCLYDDQFGYQNEVLVSPEFLTTEGQLCFQSFGNLYWCRDSHDNCDLNVWLVFDGWGGGDDIFIYSADQDWLSTFEWSPSTVELTPYLPAGTAVRLAFQYEGVNGDRVGLDAIQVTGLAPMFVQLIYLAPIEPQPGLRVVLGLVRIVDKNLAPVGGASVDLEWNLPPGYTVSQSKPTRANGAALAFMVRFWPGTYELCVTDVTADGYFYEPNQNIETCDTIVMP